MGWYRKRILKSSTIKAVNKQSSIIIYGEKEIAWLEKSLLDPGIEDI